MQRERKELLLGMEKAHKADIQTYSSGHLSPTSLIYSPPKCRPSGPIWEKLKHKDLGTPHNKEKRDMEANVDEMIDTLYHFNMANTLPVPSPSEGLDMDLKTKEVLDMSNHVKSSKATCAESLGFTGCNEWNLRQRSDMQFLRTKDLLTRKCLNGIEASGKHMHKLKQLGNVPASGNPTRERLAVFSDVFNDVCDGSPAFGCILREIKTEYDLYLKSLLSSQFTLQEMSACTPLGSFTGEMELERATKQVLSLEEKARRVLEANDRVRIEYENVQTNIMGNQRKNVSGPHPGQCNLRTNEDDMSLGVKQSEECKVSTITQVEFKRQQVWRVCKEVQRLQKEIKDKMVSTSTISALESCITDSKDEVMHLTAYNERLRRYNKELEQNILMVLNRANVSKEVKADMWKKISNKLNGDD